MNNALYVANTFGNKFTECMKYEFINQHYITQEYALPLPNTPDPANTSINQYADFGPLNTSNGYTNDIYIVLTKSYNAAGTTASSYQLWNQFYNPTGVNNHHSACGCSQNVTIQNSPVYSSNNVNMTSNLYRGRQNTYNYQDSYAAALQLLGDSRPNFPCSIPIYLAVTLFVESNPKADIRTFKTLLGGGPLNSPTYSDNPQAADMTTDAVTAGPFSDDDERKIVFYQPITVNPNDIALVDWYKSIANGIWIPQNGRLVYTVAFGFNYEYPGLDNHSQNINGWVFLKSTFAFLWTENCPQSENDSVKVPIASDGKEIASKNTDYNQAVIAVVPQPRTDQIL